MSLAKALTFSVASALLVGCSQASAPNVESAALQTEKPVEQVSQKPMKPGQETAPDMDVQNALAEKMLAQAPVGTYSLDKGHGYIAFTYDHQGYSNPQLRWGDWDSTLEWDPANPENSSVSVTINVAKVDSGVADFNDHLRSADFFDVENYPTITFESTQVRRFGGMKGSITGNLTVKDITNPVTLDVTFNKAGETRGGGHKVGFSATTQLLRSEWGVGAYVPFVGDEVDLIIEVEYERPAAE